LISPFRRFRPRCLFDAAPPFSRRDFAAAFALLLPPALRRLFRFATLLFATLPLTSLISSIRFSLQEQRLRDPTTAAAARA